MHEAYLFAGFGGQGVMFAGQLLAYAAMDAGLEVTWIPSYGPEMRGGTAHCFVVISDQPIGSPLVEKPDAALIFNRPSFEKYEPIVKKGGLLVLNASLIPDRTERTDIQEVPVPASELADELGSMRLANMIMEGAALTVRSTITTENLKQALDNHIPEHRRDMLDMNYKAIDKGAAFASKLMVHTWEGYLHHD